MFRSVVLLDTFILSISGVPNEKPEVLFRVIDKNNRRVFLLKQRIL